MSFDEPRIEKMLDPYYYMVSLLYTKAVQQLSDVPVQHVQFVGGDMNVSYSIRFIEPSYITLKALISILRIDEDEKHALLEELERANNVFALMIDDDVYAICAIDANKCKDEALRNQCDENKERGCLKILHDDEIERRSIIVASLRIMRFSKLLPRIATYVLKTLRKEELLVFSE